MTMATHKLKTWPEYFKAIKRGVKTFEIREDDRDPGFKLHDKLELEEFIPCEMCAGSGRDTRDAQQSDRCICNDSKSPRGKYTGRILFRRVGYIMHGPQWGLEEGWVIMGISKK